MGGLCRFGTSQLAQQPALGRAPQRQILHLPQVEAVIRQDLAGADPFHESRPLLLLSRARFTGRAFYGHLLGRAGDYLLRLAVEIEILFHHPPGRPRAARRILPVGQLGHLGQGGHLPGEQFPGSLHLAGEHLAIVHEKGDLRPVHRAWMQQHDVFGAHAQDLVPFQLDLELFPCTLDTGRAGLVQHQAILMDHPF